MNENILAILLARIDRLERLLYNIYNHRVCDEEMKKLGLQLYEECREYTQCEESHLEAARSMIEMTKLKQPS